MTLLSSFLIVAWIFVGIIWFLLVQDQYSSYPSNHPLKRRAARDLLLTPIWFVPFLVYLVPAIIRGFKNLLKEAK